MGSGDRKVGAAGPKEGHVERDTRRPVKVVDDASAALGGVPVSALKSDDLPALGMPTIPIFNAAPRRLVLVLARPGMYVPEGDGVSAGLGRCNRLQTSV